MRAGKMDTELTHDLFVLSRLESRVARGARQRLNIKKLGVIWQNSEGDA
jgi:hypothetical protein